MGDSDEGTVAMTDTCYEFRSGDNVMRVGWRNLGSYYVFLDGGLAVLERNLPTLLLPSLVSLGASEEEVKSALEKDKKSEGDNIHIVFPCRVGECVVEKMPLEEFKAMF